MAVGVFSAAVGVFSAAVGVFSAALGVFSAAVGVFSAALGVFSAAVGVFSAALGVCAVIGVCVADFATVCVWSAGWVEESTVMLIGASPRKSGTGSS